MAQDEKKPSAAEKGKGKAEDVKMSNGDDTSKKDKDGKPTQNGKVEEPADDELSEEDQQLKTDLEMLVDRLKEDDSSLYKPSIDQIKDFIKTSTSSMTAVPKPLKFLRPHYDDLATQYDKWHAGADRDSLADMLSVLGMTYGDEEKFETLKYRLLSKSDDLGSWGHEYIRHLALEIGQEYQNRLAEEKDVQDLSELALSLIPYFLEHNAEADAVDLLSELEMIEELPKFLDENTYHRTCLYMNSMVNLLTFPEDQQFLKTAHDIYLKYNKLSLAVILAIRLNDQELIRQDLESTDDMALRKQLAFMISRQRISFDLPMDNDDEQQVADSLGNTQLPNHFKTLAKELNILEPKTPEDIYKTHLETGRGSSAADSAKHNLASAFVNAFVNAGYGQDKLMLVSGEQRPWVWKTKDDGMMSTAASLGMLMQWDVEGSLDVIDKYQQSSVEHIKAGALLAYGIVNSGVKMEGDPIISLLSDDDVLQNGRPLIRMAAIMGLGLSYAGSAREDLLDFLLPIVEDSSLEMQLSAMAAVSLGMIFVGSSNHQVAEAIATQMMDDDRQKQLKDKWARFMALGLALLYFGKQEDVDVILDILKAIDHPMAAPTATLASVCAWAGTGAVLKLQELLHICNDHVEEKDGVENKDQQLVQSYAVLGLSLISMGEEVGQDMVLRQFGHLMHYGEANIRKAVPLAMGLISPSNPQMKIYDTLSRYSHDNDNDVAINAVFAMGLVGAGTNNARLAQLLRQLASYYHRDQNSLFMVRIAQGLVHMGKGTMSLNPFHTDRQIISPVAAAGLLTVLVSLLDAKQFILADSHYLLYFLVTAMYPRFLVTLDEDLKPLTLAVRVGQAVDVVGQAGRPKTITGWQTQSTPVLLAHGERAELEDEQYICLSSALEGLVILRKVRDSSTSY